MYTTNRVRRRSSGNDNELMNVGLPQSVDGKEVKIRRAWQGGLWHRYVVRPYHRLRLRTSLGFFATLAIVLPVVALIFIVVLEIIGRVRFQGGYFGPSPHLNTGLGFYHEMDVDMDYLARAANVPEGHSPPHLYSVAHQDTRELTAWVKERRRRTNGRKVFIGCSSHWEGYVLRSFLLMFSELKTDYGWEEMTGDDPHKYFDETSKASEGSTPFVLFFCLNWTHLPMEHLLEYYKYFASMRKKGSIIVLWNDDLHYYDQFDPLILREKIFGKVDVLVSSYAYLMDDYFASVTKDMDARDLPLTLWLPHAAGKDFTTMPMNTHPIPKILLSGHTGVTWYPLRHWLLEYQHERPDLIDQYPHTGYYVADNQSYVYATYLRSYQAAITTTLIFQYIVAKVLEIPATGSLLVINDDVSPLLEGLGLYAGQHYVSLDRRNPQAAITWVANPENADKIDAMRKAGMQVVRSSQTVSNRVASLDAFFTNGTVSYKYPPSLRIPPPCPSVAYASEKECLDHHARHARYKCDRWLCGMTSLLSKWT